MKKIKTKPCIICKKKFISKHRNKITCSDQCRLERNRRIGKAWNRTPKGKELRYRYQARFYYKNKETEELKQLLIKYLIYAGEIDRIIEKRGIKNGK